MPWMIGHQPRGKQNDCDEIKQNILAPKTPMINLGSFVGHLLYYYTIMLLNLEI